MSPSHRPCPSFIHSLWKVLFVPSLWLLPFQPNFTWLAPYLPGKKKRKTRRKKNLLMCRHFVCLFVCLSFFSREATEFYSPVTTSGWTLFEAKNRIRMLEYTSCVTCLSFTELHQFIATPAISLGTFTFNRVSLEKYTWYFNEL